MVAVRITDFGVDRARRRTWEGQGFLSCLGLVDVLLGLLVDSNALLGVFRIYRVNFVAFNCGISLIYDENDKTLAP